MVAVLAALGVTTCAAGVAGCAPKSMDVVEPDNIEITKVAPPDDGSLPTAHTCAENIAYLNYVFSGQKQYHSYSYGVTVASIAKQTTRTFRDYKDGVLLTTDLTYSSMVKNGTQTCTVVNEEGENEVYFRVSETPQEDTMPTTAVWSTEAPTYFTERAYHYTYGLLPTELFNYITNEDTIIDSEAVKVNGDGTYTQTFTFDPVDSTYFYQFGMKTRGGLGSFPEFKSITCSVTFDGGWKILSCSVHEESKINKGVIVDSVSDFTCDYFYDGENFDNEHFSYYDSYYKQYVGDETLEQGGNNDEGLVVDVTNVLSNGFSSIMNGGDQFEINVKLGENTYAGYVYLSLDLADPLGTLALKASLGRNLQNQSFYLQYIDGEMAAYYGDDFAITANLAEVKLAIEQFAGIIDQIKTAFGGNAATYAVPLEGEAQSSDPISELMNSMVVVAGEKQAVLTLKTDDLLGMGIGINANLVFGIYNNKISFSSGTVSDLSIGGEPLDISLGIGITTAPEISREATGAQADLAEYIADVHSLLGADLIKVNASLNGDGELVKIKQLKGLNADVTAYVDIDGVTAGAEAFVSYALNGVEISAKMQVWYGYEAAAGDYGEAVVGITEFNGNPVNLSVKCNVKDLADAIGSLITFSGAGFDMSVEKLVPVLSGALSVDFSHLLDNMYADKSRIKIGVNVDTLLEMLNVDAGVEFGSCTLAYKKGEGELGGELSASLPAIGFGLNVCGAAGEIADPDLTETLDISYVLSDVKAFTEAASLKLGLSLDGDAEGVTLSQLAGLKADVTAYLNVNNIAVGADAYVSYTQGENGISAKLSVWFDSALGESGKLAIQLSEVNSTPLSLGVCCDVAEAAEAVSALLDYLGVQLGSVQLPEVDAAALEEIIFNVLGADFSKLVPELGTTSDGLNLAVNVDEALNIFGVSAGFKLGTVRLAYSHTSADMLAAWAPALGLSVTVSPSEEVITAPETDECLNLTYVAQDVLALAQSDLFGVNISLDGDAEGVTLSQLAGLKADVTAYADINDVAVGVDAALSYKLGEGNVSAKLSAFYDYTAQGAGKYGKAVLNLCEINGVATSLKVYCDVEEIKDAIVTLLGYAGVQLPATAASVQAEEEQNAATADILTKILGADLGTLIPEISTSADSFKLGVNVDEVLSLFNVNAGLSFGVASLNYVHSEDSRLAATLRALGLSVGICGAEGSVEMPDTADCLNLTDLIKTVNSAWAHVNGIIEKSSLAFSVEKGATYLSLDGIKVEIWGDGEVCWKAGAEYVALDLAFSITERASDVATFRLIYDKNAVDTPLVRLALNEVGIEIYKDDIDCVVNGFNDIYNKVTALLGGNGGATEQTPSAQTPADNTQTTDALGTVTSNDKLMSLIFGILTSGDWVDVLNNLTLTTDGESVALSYLAGNSADVVITAGGDLGLYYDAKIGDRFTLGGDITVNSTTGSLIPVIEDEFASCNMSSSKKEGSAGFVKLAYDFLFEGIHSMSVDNILGSDTYAVTFVLDGDNCGVKELAGVYVDAEIYVTGADGEQGKIAEGYLNVNAAGVVIKLHVITERRNNMTYFYMNLSQVADIKLPDLKMVATQQSLFDTFSVLISAIRDTDILESVGGLLGGDGTTNENTSAGTETKPGITDEQVTTVASLLGNLLNFNFSSAVISTETDGVTTAVIDLDNVMKQLGVKTGTLGKVEAVINHNDHSMKTSGKAEVADAEGNVSLKEWISLSSALTPRRNYDEFDREEYISIEFLPDLIDDLVKFATDDSGKLHKTFTLSGSITANVVSILDINIDAATATVSLENGLGVSLIMHVCQTKVLGIGINEGTVGLTYQNGKLTLARNLNTSSPEYKITTFDYFVDHMLTDANSSLLKWWLNISGWDTLMGIVNKAAGDLNVSSGLTTPEDVYLYKAAKVQEEQEISMYDYVKALRVVVGGKQTAHFGADADISDLENNLGINDNYYGFALDAERITGGVLTKLYAALTRSESGLSGVKASGAIQSYVTFSATLGYKEGWTNAYTTGENLTSASEVTAPSFYDAATALASQAGIANIDFDHFVKKPAEGYDETFGCFSTADMSYDYSHVLYSHVLTIVGLDGSVQTRDVRHGSTVYLYDNASPVYADATKEFRLLYSTSPDGLCGKTVTMNGDLTLYAVKRRSVNVIIHNGEQELVINSFLGDSVPTSVDGLETIGVPTYADGTPIGADDVITATEPLHIYGTFVQSEVVAGYVKYTFDAATGSYVATGKAAGFNDEYSVHGKTLVLENSIGGYPVTAIADYAFANTEDKPIKSVVVPSNIVKVGAGAFQNNYGMLSAVFLADSVRMSGTAGADKNNETDQPFYGCSAEKDGTSSNLAIYYNAVEFADMTWTKVRVHEASLGIKHRYYIGNKPSNENGYGHNAGGALYAAGEWEYAGFEVNIDLNGVTDGTLNAESVSATLQEYYPVCVVGTYSGSNAAQTAEQALVNSLGQYEFESGNILYTCAYSIEYVKVNGVLKAVYNLSYVMAERATITTAVDCRYNGVLISAGSSIQVLKAVGEELLTPVPESNMNIFTGWSCSGGVYTANWRERATYSLKVNVSKGLTDRNNFYVNGTKVDSISVSVVEGQVEISITDKVLIVKDMFNTYRIEIKEIKFFGNEGDNRNISSTSVGTTTASGNFEITVSY